MTNGTDTGAPDEDALRELFRGQVDPPAADGADPVAAELLTEVRRRTAVRDVLDVTVGGMFKLVGELIGRFGPRA